MKCSASARSKQARDIDARLAKGETVGPLAGVPIAIKDNMLIRGEHCTCSSKILEGFVGTYDVDRDPQARAGRRRFPRPDQSG